jgi:adenylate kinase family enzyme
LLRRIHITGASGSGTTTLGAALAGRRCARHLDTDAFYWLTTEPPFTAKRPVVERVALMRAELEGAASWVISGSLMGWGDVFIPHFDLVVFLHVPTDERLARLAERERRRYGAAIDPGGPMHAGSAAFMTWAAGYETAGFEGRSLERHKDWLSGLPCAVLELAGTPSLDESVRRVTKALG